MKKITKKIREPKILTANTYFWKPGSSASWRRSNEEKRLGEVKDFFEMIGLEVIQDGDTLRGHYCDEKTTLEVKFSYTESCNNVYKSLKVWKNDKNSNITSLRKLYS